MNSLKEQRKPTLQQLRQEHHLTAQAVADEAGVPLRIEYLMEIGCTVTRIDAEKIINALARLTGTFYSRGSIRGVVFKEGPGQFSRSKHP